MLTDKQYQSQLGKNSLHVVEWAGKKGPIVCVHGLTANCLHFQVLAETLVPEYKMYALDIRGRGNSSSADDDTTVLKHAEEVIALIEDLGLENPLIIGHSMGAYISAIVASRYEKLRGLVLLDGAGVVTNQDIVKIEPALIRLDNTFPSVEAYIEGAKPLYAAMNLNWNNFIENSVRYEVGEIEDGLFKFKGDSRKIQKDLISLVEYNHHSILPKIECPVLLVYAKGNMGPAPLYYEDAYSITKELIPHLEYYVSEGNHFTIVHEVLPELQSVIKRFVDKCFND